MMYKDKKHPVLYQINTRVWLTELSRNLRRRATLNDIPEADLDRFASLGFDWIWLLSVWQTGFAGRKVSRTNAEWRKEFEETLPDLQEQDIAGSGFAIKNYSVHEDLGGDEALATFRERLLKRGLRLLLDFVPNHMALDHVWVKEHPDYFVAGTDLDLSRNSQNYVKIDDRVFAHGRDPYFPGWPDTLQINYGNPEAQEALRNELLKIAGRCDGVRCDMAMLVLPEIFERTWGIATEPFWPGATQLVRNHYPDFCFIAEVYWDMEWTLQQQGFDYTYDKRLYDRLREGHARPVREHFFAGMDYQEKLARFLENHDEPRAANTFSLPVHQAAAVLTFCSPGLAFFHQGQFEGKRKRISPHLARGPVEPVERNIQQFYDRLLAVLQEPSIRTGEWKLLECVPAWEGNWTSDCFLAFSWRSKDGVLLLVIVNFAPNQSQCYVKLPFSELEHSSWRLEDRLNDAVYHREGDDLVNKGLYLDEPGWKAYVFSVIKK